MSTRTISLIAFASSALVLASCGEPRNDDSGLMQDTDAQNTGASMSGGSGDDVEKLDLGGPGDDIPGCAGDGTCNMIDLLFVIDNSGTMGEEQLNLAANLPGLVAQLQDLKDADGNRVNPDVNIMITTTDMGHPLCSPFQKADYEPAQGKPVYQGCNTRINRFTGLDEENPIQKLEACTANCPVDIGPGDQFIHMDSDGTNVPNDDVAAALSCVGPQGIDGCGYEAPLESMIQAIDPTKCWNDPDQEQCADNPEFSSMKKGFLREGATLAVAIITDEADCSVQTPGGFSYFTDDEQYWAQNPEVDYKQATSAVCWNAGVTCDDANGDGVYEDCHSIEGDALHPVERYTSYLRYLREEKNKEVIMLGILGVPPVTEHNIAPPFQPTVGGLMDLEYRDWADGEYPDGDILPDEWAAGKTADGKRFEFGSIGPGCTGSDSDGNFTGQAIPPVRIREVCESLNYTDSAGRDQVRCCVESICDEDFSPAIQCLTGIIQDTIQVAG
jgi:hypothetical protein